MFYIQWDANRVYDVEAFDDGLEVTPESDVLTALSVFERAPGGAIVDESMYFAIHSVYGIEGGEA